VGQKEQHQQLTRPCPLSQPVLLRGAAVPLPHVGAVQQGYLERWQSRGSLAACLL